jgi:hypothetical protein
MAWRWCLPASVISGTDLVAAGTEFVISLEGSEIRLTPLPMLPVTTVDDAAGLLARRGKKKTNEQTTHTNISSMLKARDATTRDQVV